MFGFCRPFVWLLAKTDQRIYKNHYTVTDIYYEPGYHLAKLIANDSAIRVAEVSIPTDRWVFYANEQKEKLKAEATRAVTKKLGGLLGR